MQAFMISAIYSVLMASIVLAGPIGRYPMMKRNAEKGNTPTSTALGAQLVPPVTASISGLFSSIVVDTDAVTVTVTETVQSTSAAATSVTSEEPAAPSSSAASAIETSSAMIPTSTVVTSVAATGSASDTAVAPSTSAATSAVDATSTAQAVPTSKPVLTSSETAPATSSSAPPSASSVPGKPDNKQLAIKQNQFYATLTTASECDPADPLVFNACINGAYAQCSTAGKYVIFTECAAPLKCFALPLERGSGMSVACTTTADAAFRMGFATTAEFQLAMGSGNASSTAPISTVTSSADSTSASTALPVELTTTASVVEETSSAGVPTATSAASTSEISSSAQALLPTTSSSEVPATTASATQIIVTTTLPGQDPKLPVPTGTTLSSSSVPVPTPTSRPGNQAPVVTPFPAAEGSAFATVIVDTTTIRGGL